MNNYIEYFTNYIYKNYDMNNPLISLKYYHSLRVAKLMAIFMEKMNQSDDDVLLAFKLGLCHDLGRFYEVIRNGKFDNKIFDHGSYGNKILYNDSFVKYIDIDEHLLFRKAIYNHDKKDITNDLTKRESFFVNLLRDMDKIDILNVRCNMKRLSFDKTPTDKVLNCYNNNKTIDISNINNTSDSILLYLGFIKNLYFDLSWDMAINYGYLIEFLKIIDVSDDKEELFNSIVKKIYEERGKVYVR